MIKLNKQVNELQRIVDRLDNQIDALSDIEGREEDVEDLIDERDDIEVALVYLIDYYEY